MNQSRFLFLLLWCFLMGSTVNGQAQDFVPVAEGWICDENFQPQSPSKGRIPLKLGSDIRICIQPTNWTQSRRVVMRSIDRFVFSKGDRGRNGVQDVIKDGRVVDPGGTSIACQAGAEICTFKTRLLDEFFFPAKVDGEHELPPSYTVIQGNGAVSMEYATRGGGRRLLRGTIIIQRSRQAQASAGNLAGTDDIQILDIPISEQERGKGGDTDTSDSTSLSDKWESLPTWAKAMSCLGIAFILLFCCCALGFFGWFVGVEFSKRKVQEQISPKITVPRASMNGDTSGRTVDDDVSSLRSSGRYGFPGRINQLAEASSAKNQSHIDSSNRFAQGRRPVRNSTSDASVSSGRRDPRAFGSNVPNRKCRSHSPKLYPGTDDSTAGPFREKRQSIPTRNTRMSSTGPNAPLSLSGGSNHCRSVGGRSSASMPSHRRHASLGPSSVHSRSTNGLSQSQHSHLPRRASSSVSGNSHHNDNLDLPRRSTHSNRPLTRNSYHGPPSRPGRGVPRQSFGPNTTTATSLNGPSCRSEHTRGSNIHHGPPRIRIPVRSDPSRRQPGQQFPQFVNVSQEADSSNSSDDDDDVASFASASHTQGRQSDTESLSESIRHPNKKPVKTVVKKKKVASPPSIPQTTKKGNTPIKNSKTKPEANPKVPGRVVSKMDLVDKRRESESRPNDENKSAIKKVVTKKKTKKKKVAEEPPTITEEKQEEAWGDQLD